MRTILSAIVLAIVTLTPTAAQRVVGGTAPQFPPAKGTAILHRTLPPRYIPDSLKGLVDQLSAIVEAYVQITLPPQEIPASSLFTDAVLRVVRMFKGPANLTAIVVGQQGGTVGAFTIKPAQYDMMQPGEHYILFLRDENRRNLLERPGMVRFALTGEWGGSFRIRDDNTIKLARATSSALRAAYQGKPADQVVNELLNVIPH
jgi:hypothetical protein